MNKPRIFLGSSGKQARLIQALTRGLADVATVEPWTTSFTPGTTTLGRLVDLAHQVDFAAFIFARDDWTNSDTPSVPEVGQASPRDNVVFEAGLFGGVIGMERTFILHASGAKLPSDLLGLTAVRYGETLGPAEMRAINQKLRAAIVEGGRRSRIEGPWWQFSLTERSLPEPACPRVTRPAPARRRRALRDVPERGGPRTCRWSGGFLLLAGRASPRPQRAAVERGRRDPAGDRRPREWVLHHAIGCRPATQRAHVRHLRARRRLRRRDTGWRQRSGSRGAARDEAPGLESDAALTDHDWARSLDRFDHFPASERAAGSAASRSQVCTTVSGFSDIDPMPSRTSHSARSG